MPAFTQNVVFRIGECFIVRLELDPPNVLVNEVMKAVLQALSSVSDDL